MGGSRIQAGAASGCSRIAIALGCFASALTKSQLVAAAVSYGVGLTLFILGMGAMVPTTPTGWQAKVMSHISMTDHMEDFARGILHTTPIIYYLSLTTFFIFLTYKVIESRRWKN